SGGGVIARRQGEAAAHVGVSRQAASAPPTGKLARDELFTACANRAAGNAEPVNCLRLDRILEDWRRYRRIAVEGERGAARGIGVLRPELAVLKEFFASSGIFFAGHGVEAVGQSRGIEEADDGDVGAGFDGVFHVTARELRLRTPSATTASRMIAPWIAFS